MPRYEKKLGDFATFFMDATKLNVDIILKGVVAVSKRHGQLVKGDFDKTVGTWDHKPTFKYSVTKQTGDVVLRAGLSDWVDTGRHGGSDPEWHWVWLTLGTSKRWSILSDDWRSKTMPKVVRSRGGQGSVLAKGFLAGQPRKGITAREWVPTIEANRKPQYDADIIRTLKWSALRIWQ